MIVEIDGTLFDIIHHKEPSSDYEQEDLMRQIKVMMVAFKALYNNGPWEYAHWCEFMESMGYICVEVDRDLITLSFEVDYEEED